jgi:hypothetical protein
VIPGIITLVRSVKPAQKCNAKKEDYLLSDREIFLPHDYCPVCKEQFQTLCRIANHPSKGMNTFLEAFELLSFSGIRWIIIHDSALL